MSSKVTKNKNTQNMGSSKSMYGFSKQKTQDQHEQEIKMANTAKIILEVLIIGGAIVVGVILGGRNKSASVNTTENSAYVEYVEVEDMN